MTPADSDPFVIAGRVSALLESFGMPCSVGGSVASSLAGEPRSSLDVDIVVLFEPSRIDELAAALDRDFYVPRAALARAAAEKTSVNVIHRRTSLKVDLFAVGGTAIDEDVLSRRIEVTVGDPPIRLHVHTPEDILLLKLRWYRRGGEVSDRQWRDVLGIVRVQQVRLDQTYLRRGAKRLDVEDLLERALDEAFG